MKVWSGETMMGETSMYQGNWLRKDKCIKFRDGEWRVDKDCTLTDERKIGLTRTGTGRGRYIDKGKSDLSRGYIDWGKIRLSSIWTVKGGYINWEKIGLPRRYIDCGKTGLTSTGTGRERYIDLGKISLSSTGFVEVRVHWLRKNGSIRRVDLLRKDVYQVPWWYLGKLGLSSTGTVKVGYIDWGKTCLSSTGTELRKVWSIK